MTKTKDAPKEMKFCNVALLPEDHKMLRLLADIDQRTMTRQLSVIIRKEFAMLEQSATVS